MKVKGRSEASTYRAAKWYSESFPELDVQVVHSEQEAIENSDILIAGTSTSKDGPQAFPYFKSEWLKPGALVLAPAAARFDDDFVTSDKAKLVVDYRGLYNEWFHENGPNVTYEELLGIPGNRWWDMKEEGKLREDQLANIGDIASGHVPGRTNDEEIFLYSIGGMPVEDVAWATDLYEYARRNNIGTPLNLWDTPALS